MSGLASGQEQRAASYVIEAEKILNKRGLLSGIFGPSSSQRCEDAAELFRKAGIALKVSKKWEEAGDVFIRAGELEDKAGESTHSAANAYLEASKCYKSADMPEKVAPASQAAQERFLEMGRFTQVAKMLKETAEAYEKEGSYKEAIDAFQQASDFFAGEKSTQGSNQCKSAIILQHLSKPNTPEDESGPAAPSPMSHVNSNYKEYNENRAAELFEELGNSCADTPLLRMNAKNHFFNACLCMMASGDMVALGQKLGEFKGIDHSFAGSRECKFVEELAVSVDEFNEERFSTAAYEYDRVTALDPWKTAILLTIKRQIDGGGSDGGEDVDLT